MTPRNSNFPASDPPLRRTDGGFIYLKAECDGNGEVIPDKMKVVGINAISIAPDPPIYVGGSIERHREDDSVTAKITSPEMWNGDNIGLETDMYAFGIVMWEVFTRREAWHWLPAGMDPTARGLSICDRVSPPKNRRPKMPAGLSENCAEMVRRCLHADPFCRPDAKEVSAWLQKQKNGLKKQMQSRKTAKVKESDEILRRQASAASAASAGKHDQDASWSITDSGDLDEAKCWNHGQYSLDHLEHLDRAKLGDASFSLTVNAATQAHWEENAQVSAEPLQLQPRRHSSNKIGLPPLPLGLAFKVKSESGEGMVDKWPEVARIDFETKDKKDKEGTLVKGSKTLAPMFPEIKVGCRITKINGEEVPPTFKEALPKLRTRPFTLEFMAPERSKAVVPIWATPMWSSASTESEVPHWIRAGLEAVQTVRQHEEREIKLWREVPESEVSLDEQLVAAERQAERLRARIAQRDGTEGEPPADRALSADLESTGSLEPELEPEPEPEPEPSDDDEFQSAGEDETPRRTPRAG